jgi:Rrf2 family protein
MNSDAGPRARRDIAKGQGISADYVAQLFRLLRDAGIIRGIRGPGGGYALARPAVEITAGDVIRAVEGPMAITECVTPGATPECDRVGECVTRSVWKELSAAMADFLDSVTVQDLCDRMDAQRECEADPAD